PDEAVRAAAAIALARIGVANLELARRAPAHPPPAGRLARTEPPVAAIAAGGGAPATRALDRAASSPAWAVRAGAANLAVRAVGKDAAVALAHRLTTDPELAVRLAAARV